LIALLAGSIGGFIAVKRNQRGRDTWDAFKLRIPMKIGEVVQKVAIARVVAHAVSAHIGRRADHAGDRDHRQDRR
jgi:type II secretory pathway component PulF